ncbi:4'-phosphopantetheinyl transferase family protein [Stenoxybacter acetivorans]|uniref:4'-phosphopantetheinyl transferase family protein n=1 Tax=Stenoxybacter acetivorans TaxID=422441 RepID=UPI0006905B88|nr:4'-phosphopantetheinyl transferase superfamily protein [Stenoxybacter acetivorans]
MCNRKEFNILLARSECAKYYCADSLDQIDAERATVAPELHRRLDWRSSRYLKHHCRVHYPQQRLLSLSHKKGCAAALLGPADTETEMGTAAGIDLEYLQARDFAALLPLFSRKNEIEWWQTQDDAALVFYRLWTLKEALIKAANLHFPADLNRVGLFADKKQGLTAGVAVQEAMQPWQHQWFSPDDKLLICCVWQGVFQAALSVTEVVLSEETKQ